MGAESDRNLRRKWSESSLFIYGPPIRNRVFGQCGQRRPRSAYASAKSNQGLHCPLKESFDTKECMNGEHGTRMIICAYTDLWIWISAFAHVRRYLSAWRDPYDIITVASWHGSISSCQTKSFEVFILQHLSMQKKTTCNAYTRTNIQVPRSTWDLRNLIRAFVICTYLGCAEWKIGRQTYSRLSLSRIPRDTLKYFKISVLWHIRFAELRKK